MIILNKIGEELCRVKDFEYNGEFMGDRKVVAKCASPTPIAFNVGDYVELLGEVFKVYRKPSPKKIASKESYGGAFEYTVELLSAGEELKKCSFQDYVISDNGVHYSKFNRPEFFGSVKMLAERIQVNLDRLYQGKEKWSVSVSESFNSEAQRVGVNNLSCREALHLAYSQFGANYTIRGKSIVIGTQGAVIDNSFEYGKGRGFVTIDEVTKNDQKIVTRLIPYGSKKNLRDDYNKGVGVYAESFVAPGLMLPNASSSGIDYVDSENISEFGVCEGVEQFEEVFPTLEGITAEDLKKSGVAVNASGRIDEVVSASVVADDKQATVSVFIKDLGFDINKHLGKEKASISFKSGDCVGSELSIASCTKEGDGYKLVVNRKDEGGFIIPNKGQDIKEGDRFVLLNIVMPEVYEKAAEQRLLNVAKEWLSKNDHEVKTYSPTIDNIFLDENKELAKKLREGDILQFVDYDLGISKGIIIQTLNIKFGGIIPEYSVVLSDKKAIGFTERLFSVENRFQMLSTTIETTFKDGIITDSELAILRNSLEDFKREKESVDSTYGVVYGSEHLKKEQKEIIEGKKNEYNSAHKALSDKITEVIEDKVITEKEREEVDLLLAEYSKALAEYKKTEELAKRAISDEINEAFGDKFLSRKKDDTARGKITFLRGLMSKAKSLFEKGIKVKGKSEIEDIELEKQIASKDFSKASSEELTGSGFGVWRDEQGDWHSSLDYFTVRKGMNINTLRIKETKSISGAELQTLADQKNSRVEDMGEFYRCYFDSDDGTIKNYFEVGDLAICQKFDSKKQKRYWRAVVGVGSDYIDLSKKDKERGSNSKPEVGDDVVQFGNKTNPERQNAILRSAFGNVGDFKYKGINDFTTEGKLFSENSLNRSFYKGEEFIVETGGKSISMAVERGKWEAGLYGKNNIVSHLGKEWISLSETDEEPGSGSRWKIREVGRVGGVNLIRNADGRLGDKYWKGGAFEEVDSQEVEEQANQEVRLVSVLGFGRKAIKTNNKVIGL